jgi:hypothetical protein
MDDVFIHSARSMPCIIPLIAWRGLERCRRWSVEAG